MEPEAMRSRLIAAAIYVAGFEILKNTFVDRIRDFFRTGFDESGDRIDPEYQSDVLARRKSPVYASLSWLKEMKAISNADEEVFERVKALRNKLAHELLPTIGSGGLPFDFDECFHDMVALLRKIEVWWIMNVEVTVNPDYDGIDMDEDDVLPGSVMLIQILCDIALGDEERSRYYYEEFRKQSENGR